MRIPAQAFDDPQLCALVEGWAQMHAGNYGPGATTKMGLYVIDPDGTSARFLTESDGGRPLWQPRP